MPRWSEYDTDEERLPEGMKRIGYDADSQTYTFRDADGSIWESAPGNRYGQLQRITTTLPSYSEEDETSPTLPLTFSGPDDSDRPVSWREEMSPLLNWFLLVGVFLLGIFWFISRGNKGSTEIVRSCNVDTIQYKIRTGDTCWAISEAKSIPLDVLLENNEGLDCDKLAVGETLCVPNS